MRREWSYHRSSGGKKRILLLIFLGVFLFALGFFAARPILQLFGLI